MDREIKDGVRVHYTAPHGSKENGIVKSVNLSRTAAFVVYKCAGDWKNYKDYTAARTDISYLQFGWVDKDGNLMKEFCDHYYIPTNAKWQPENQRQCQFCGDIIN